MHALGVDLGGTKILAGVINDFRVVSDIKRVPTPKGASNIVSAIEGLIDSFKDDYLISGVGLSTAGIVNVDTGEVIGSTGNLPGWEGTKIKSHIERKYMLPTHVENDANAAAYGESHAAGLGDKKCIIAVALGTGIGVGIVIDGKLYRGAHWAGGECGHLKVSMDNKRLCTCGLWDCWEAYGCGGGFVVTAKEFLQGVSKEQSSLVEKIDTLTTRDIIEAGKKGDPISRKTLEKWHEHVACGMVSLAHSFDPDCFLMTGGMSEFIDYSLLKEMLIDRTIPRVSEHVDIRPSVLSTEAGMIGAARLVIDGIRERAVV